MTTFLFSQPMTAQVDTHIKFEGKSYTWYVKAVPNMGDEIHCDVKDPNSDGYGGSTLTFKLATGESVAVKGPWHSNCNAMLQDTGVDLSQMHHTRYIIADRLQGDFYEGLTAEGLHHLQDEPKLGSFKQDEEHANRIARKLGRNVQYARQSARGACITFTRLEFDNE